MQGEPREQGEDITRLWWRSLCAVAVLNLALWTWTALRVPCEQPRAVWQLGLSGVFTLVCAYRSLLPRIDLERTVLIDTPWSSVVLGRSAATLAELSFAAQVALWIHELGAQAGLPALQTLAWLLVPMLALAQLFCWYGVLTLNHLGHAIEESLWALSFGLVGVGLLLATPLLEGRAQGLAGLGALLCAGYVAFMVRVDVPMYLHRWRAGRAQQQHYMSLREGFIDALTRREATRAWAVWKPEVAWLSGYFSAAVWVSLALVHLSS